MRVPSLAICTLAVLTAGDIGSIVHANPSPSSSPQGVEDASHGNYVVPVTTATSAPATVIAAPETQATPEFTAETVVETHPLAVSANSAEQTVEVETHSAVPSLAPTAQTAEVQTKPAIQPAKPTPQIAQVQRGTATQSVKPPLQTAQVQRGTTPQTPDLVVTATDVQVVGATEELHQLVRNTIRTRSGGNTSQSQLQSDVAAILNTGLFTDANVNSYENSAGLSVVYQVKPVVVRSLQLQGAQVLTPAVANDIFKSQLGQPVSPTAVRSAVQALNKWYTDNGYAVAQVLDARTNQNGVITLEAAEGVVGNVNIRFVDKDGQPTKGRSKEDFLRREIKLKPGEVFRVDTARQDLQQLYRLGLFENADVSLNGDAKKVDVTYELIERPARAVNAGGGYSENSGLYGTLSYNDQNFGGVNQRLGVDVQVGRDVSFDARFSDPYRASDPDRLGYSVNAFRRRVLSQTFNEDINLPNGDKVREGQFGGGVSLTKPVGEWLGSAGLNYTRTSIRERDGELSPVDELGNQLSFSETGIDDLVTLSAGVSRDRRNNPVNPTEGSVLSFSTEQSIPIGNGNILMNRVKGNYSQYVPINLFSDNKREVLAFNVQGGTVIGDLPPYEAFNLGGINSVRGYGSGDVASGRSFVQASAEYRFPIINMVGGVLFADFASDLGSSDTVPGQPGVVRDKPGAGFGYGAGLRVNSPIGLIRADYGFNDQGESRFQFGLGQRF